MYTHCSLKKTRPLWSQIRQTVRLDLLAKAHNTFIKPRVQHAGLGDRSSAEACWQYSL